MDRSVLSFDLLCGDPGLLHLAIDGSEGFERGPQTAKLGELPVGGLAVARALIGLSETVPGDVVGGVERDRLFK